MGAGEQGGREHVAIHPVQRYMTQLLPPYQSTRRLHSTDLDPRSSQELTFSLRVRSSSSSPASSYAHSADSLSSPALSHLLLQGSLLLLQPCLIVCAQR